MKKFLILGIALVFSSVAMAQPRGPYKVKQPYRYEVNRYGIMRYRAVEPCNTRCCIMRRAEFYRMHHCGWRVNLDFDNIHSEFMH